MDYLSAYLKMVRSFKVTIMMDIFVETAWRSIKMVIFISDTLKMESREDMVLFTPLQLNKSIKALGRMIYLMDKAIITIIKQLIKDSFQTV